MSIVGNGNDIRGGCMMMDVGQSGALVIRDQDRDHDVAPPALLCHKEPAPIKGPFCAWKPPIPYAIKNQRGASKIPPNAMGVFCVPKPLVGGFGCDELVLYGIRELA